jgi:hypothetical protein
MCVATECVNVNSDFSLLDAFDEKRKNQKKSREKEDFFVNETERKKERKKEREREREREENGPCVAHERGEWQWTTLRSLRPTTQTPSHWPLRELSE